MEALHHRCLPVEGPHHFRRHVEALRRHRSPVEGPHHHRRHVEFLRRHRLPVEGAHHRRLSWRHRTIVEDFMGLGPLTYWDSTPSMHAWRECTIDARMEGQCATHTYGRFFRFCRQLVRRIPQQWAWGSAQSTPPLQSWRDSRFHLHHEGLRRRAGRSTFTIDIEARRLHRRAGGTLVFIIITESSEARRLHHGAGIAHLRH